MNRTENEPKCEICGNNLEYLWSEYFETIEGRPIDRVIYLCKKCNKEFEELE